MKLRAPVSLLPAVIAVIAAGAAPAQMPFSPPPTVGDEFSFIAYGDIQHNQGGALQKLVPLMMADEPAFIIQAGDISKDDGKGYESTFLPAVRPLAERVAFFPTPGNHDVHFGRPTSRINFSTFFEAPLDWLATLPQNTHLTEEPRQKLWYSLTVGGLAFVALDSNLIIDEGQYRKTHRLEAYRGYRQQQLSWLAAEIERINTDPAIRGGFLFMHHSTVYSVENKKKLGLFGGHPGHRRMMLTAKLPSGAFLFDAVRASKINGVFSGHVHFYERWSERLVSGDDQRQFNWLVVGNGGARTRGNALSDPDEIARELAKPELAAHRKRCVPRTDRPQAPCWNTTLSHEFPTPESPESRFFGYTVVRVTADRITFESKDTAGAVRDSGVLWELD